MEFKKNPNVDVGRNSSLYFAIGLNIMLLFTYLALESKSYDKETDTHMVLEFSEELEEDIPIINLETQAPPPPPPAAPAVILVVEDAVEIEETIIETSETNQEDKIAEPIVAVEDIMVEEIEEDISIPFSVVERIPIFPGCTGNNDALKKCFNEKIAIHVKTHLKYPESAVEMGIHGRVYVLFVIDSKGCVNNIRTRGPDSSLEKEAARIIALLPQMVPAQQRDRTVTVPYSIPIKFTLGN